MPRLGPQMENSEKTENVYFALVAEGDSLWKTIVAAVGLLTTRGKLSAVPAGDTSLAWAGHGLRGETVQPIM